MATNLLTWLHKHWTIVAWLVAMVLSVSSLYTAQQVSAQNIQGRLDTIEEEIDSDNVTANELIPQFHALKQEVTSMNKQLDRVETKLDDLIKLQLGR